MATAKKTTTAIEESSEEKVQKTKAKKSIFKLSVLRKNLKKQYERRPKLYLGALIILLISVGLFFFFWFNKGLFLAGNINGKIITSLQFYNDLKKTSGQKVFNSIVRETLIKQEAKRLGVRASTEDVNQKIREIEKNVGGKENLEAALAQNQTDIEDLRNQLAIQVLVEKILGNQLNVTDEEIKKYLSDNKETAAKLSKDEIKETLKIEKLNEKFGPWYQELESRARIIRYF